MDYEAGLEMLKFFGADNRLVNHSVGVAGVAYELASKVNGHGVNPERVRVAGLLHDIGRTIGEPHEIYSGAILMNMDKKLAGIVRQHGFLYEKMKLAGIVVQDLLPVQMENKIVALADGYFGQRRMSLKERFDDIRERYQNDGMFVKAVDMAQGRFEQMEREIVRGKG